MTLYYQVTNDKYELITAIADSSRELAELCGVKQKTVCEGIRRYETGMYNSHFRKVEVDDE